MLGMPAPGEKITLEAGSRRIAELASMAREYPTGLPYPVTVTMSDEQWVAVMFAVASIVVHEATEGAPQVFPEWVNPRQREALEAIWEANMGAVGG